LSAEQYTLLGAIVLFSTQVVVYFQGINTKKTLHELHITMNSRLDELLKATAQQAHSEGHASGIDEERKRTK